MSNVFRDAELNRLLEEAVELPSDEWRPFLEQAAGDLELAREAEALLNGEAGLGGFMAHPLVEPSEAPTTEDPNDSDFSEDLPHRWGRFETRRVLGTGGMGVVLEAFDPELQRRLALKLVRAPNPELEARFQREARAQARIDHEHVCKVFEVGEHEGRPYIAMQYLEGQTLDEAAEGLTLEQKIKVMLAVCEGLHAAHRTGLIHRDVKPGNVMVAERDNGGLSVHVMDFGLAREMVGRGLTEAGTVIGTPHYMAPEQAQHSTGGLDRRTDVYGLGATLYKLLTGRTPFAGSSGLEVVQRVLLEDPPPLRRFVPSLPQDLEIIVLKCLEKDPSRRYASARALAEDLRRFLHDEPIEARSDSRLYRLRHYARKHRAALGVVTVLAVLLVAALSAAVVERLRARAIAGAAQRFGREIESLTWIQRAAHQLPLHDVRAARAVLRARMQSIEARMAELGAAGRGPGLYALGRGHLALGEIELAQARLEAAWDLGYREATVAEALGQVLAVRYGDALAEARRIPEGPVREVRLDQLDRRWRRPALDFLQAGREADLEAPQLTAARIAFLEGRWQEAEILARQVVERLPWRYEGLLIAGGAASERARELEEVGEHSAAEDGYREAEVAFSRATQIGPSDPETWLALCRLGRSRGLLAQNKLGLDAGRDFAEALEACDKSLSASPDHVGALGERAMILGYVAEAAAARGEDPGDALEVAEAASRRAIEVAPGSVGGWLALGLLKTIETDVLAAAGEDVGPSLEEALSSLEKAAELEPDFAHVHHLLALAMMQRAQEAERRGEASELWLDRALAESERTIELAPRFVNANLGASAILWQRAGLAQAKGEDPLPWQQRGIEILRTALEINPGLGFAHVNLGALLHGAAKSTVRRHGGDARSLLDESVASFEKAIELVPEDAFAHLNLGHALVTRALWQAGLGEDPRPWLEQARQRFDKGIELAPGLSGPPAARGETWWLEALWLEAEGGDPKAALERAARGVRESRQLSEADPEHRILEARLVAMRARLAGRLEMSGEIDRAVAELEAARAIGQEALEARLVLAFLRLEEAFYALAADGSPDEPARAGRRLVDDLLAQEPGLASALGLRAGFLLLDALGTSGPSAETLRNEARQLLDHALELDPMTRLELAPILRRAGG